MAHQGFWLIALLGCGGIPCEAETASLEVGTGEDIFVPLESGDPLPFYLGPQGGFHVFASLRASGIYEGEDRFDEDNPLVSISIETATEAVAAAAQPIQFLGGELLGQLVVLAHPNPPSLEGGTVTYRASVEDACGLNAEDTVTAVLAFATE